MEVLPQKMFPRKLPLILIMLIQMSAVSCAPLCQPCQAGEGVSHPCNSMHGTVCSPCSAGHFSSGTSSEACTPCSLCGSGLFELHACTAKNDVFCELCSLVQNLSNPDYLLKCKDDMEYDMVFRYSWENHEDSGQNQRSEEDRVERPGDQDDTPSHHIPQGLAAPSRDELSYDGLEQLQIKPDKTREDAAAASFDWGESSGDDLPEKERVVTETPKAVVSDKMESIGDILQEEELLPSNPSKEHGLIPESNEDQETHEELGSGVDIEAYVGSGDVDDRNEASAPLLGLEDLSTKSLIYTTLLEGEKSESSSSDSSEESDKDIAKEKIPALTTASLIHKEPIAPRGDVTGTDKGEIDTVDVTTQYSGDVTPQEQKLKKAKIAVIVPVVIVGAVALIVIFFVVRKCRNRKCTKEYVPAPMDVPEMSKDEKCIKEFKAVDDSKLDGETTPLKSTSVDAGDSVSHEAVNSIATGPPTDNSGCSSPINITPDEAEFDVILEQNPVHVRYQSEQNREVQNTGSTVKITFDSETSIINGGPLSSAYRLACCTLHWGAKDDCGSGHTVSGIKYSAELQLLHWNTSKYKSFQESLKANEGLAAVSVLIKIGDQHNTINAITECLDKIRYKGKTFKLACPDFDPSNLLPSNRTDYWTYSGSLTEPPFNDNVTWIVFKEPINISRQQIEAFRSLRPSEEDEDHTTGRTKREDLDHVSHAVLSDNRHIRSSFS